MSDSFWIQLDTLVKTSEIVIDRPKGTRHPRFQDMIYPLDYGYLSGTSEATGTRSMCGGGRCPWSALRPWSVPLI